MRHRQYSMHTLFAERNCGKEILTEAEIKRANNALAYVSFANNARTDCASERVER